jgi:phosphoribosylformimino-5-aminoimidazole carboxamide ribotide isomerase
VIAIPAVDLRDGQCVQLVGGSYEHERVRLPDPVRVAADWAGMGFRRLHVVDLDAATGRSPNREVVRALLSRSKMEIQVGGGIRSEAQISEWLASGARAVVVGTRAMEDPSWLATVAARFPSQLVVAADVRGRNIVAHGWQQSLPEEIGGVIGRLNELPLAAVLVTAVHQEGKMAGTDLALMAEVARASRHPLQASGGIASEIELRSLAQAGVAGAILGMALYMGALDGRAIAKEFSS